MSFLKQLIMVLSALICIQSGFASTIPSGTQIASCVVIQSQNSGNVGTVVEVYKLNDASSSILVAMGQPNSKTILPANAALFSADRSSLDIKIANVIEIMIPNGQQSAGKMGDAGNGTSQMICNTSW